MNDLTSRNACTVDQIATLLSRSAFMTTETELALMAAATIIGLSRSPGEGKQHSRSDRHAERVANEGEEEVLADVAEANSLLDGRITHTDSFVAPLIGYLEHDRRCTRSLQTNECAYLPVEDLDPAEERIVFDFAGRQLDACDPCLNRLLRAEGELVAIKVIVATGRSEVEGEGLRIHGQDGHLERFVGRQKSVLTRESGRPRQRIRLGQQLGRGDRQLRREWTPKTCEQAAASRIPAGNVSSCR